MSIITKGQNFDLILFVVIAACAFYYLFRAVRGQAMPLRELAPFTAISDAVDRCVEEGLPVWAAAGDYAYLSGTYAPMTIAGMNVVRYTARLAVRKGARIILPVPVIPETLPLLDGIFREVCVSEGKPEAYRRDDVLYFGKEWYDYSIGNSAVMRRDGVGAWIDVGSLTGGGGYLVCTTALEQGAIVIAGSPRLATIASYTVFSHYPFIGEDVYAAGDYASGDPVVMSGRWSGDIVKLLSIAMFVVFFLAVVVDKSVMNLFTW